MGREIRKVPPHWDHPKEEDGRLQPMHDRTFADAATEWKEAFAKWEAGERPDYCADESKTLEYWEYDGGPPDDRAYYRPWKDEQATWFQVWETVSEGTPVTPPFATQAELVDYLVQRGDFWDQRRGVGGWDRKSAESFVSEGWAPSMIVVQSSEGNRIFEARDGSPP